MQIKQAFVLAGGKGERLKPLTNDIPKPLVKVNGKPILQYAVERLVDAGIKEIVLSTGHMHDKLEAYFGSGEKFGADIVYAVEDEPLGTGGALGNALEMLDGSFVMLNGDNIADFDYARMEETHSSSGAAVTITLVEVEDVSGFGVAKVSDNRILEFVEKPPKGEEPSKLVNAGAYIIKKEAVTLPDGFSLIEKALFPKLAAEGKLGFYRHEGLWQTTDTLERLKAAEEAIIKKEGKSQ